MKYKIAIESVRNATKDLAWMFSPDPLYRLLSAGTRQSLYHIVQETQSMRNSTPPLCFMIMDNNTWKMILERQVLSFKSIWNVFKFLKLSALRFIIKMNSLISFNLQFCNGYRLKVTIIPAVPSLAFLCTTKHFWTIFYANNQTCHKPLIE